MLYVLNDHILISVVSFQLHVNRSKPCEWRHEDQVSEQNGPANNIWCNVGECFSAQEIERLLPANKTLKMDHLLLVLELLAFLFYFLPVLRSCNIFYRRLQRNLHFIRIHMSDLGVHNVAEVEEGSLAYTCLRSVFLSNFFFIHKKYIYIVKKVFFLKRILATRSVKYCTN